MLQYAVKRIIYSLLIMLGVLIVTFLLFRLAAGDPTETLLGKNPMPEEIERMRSTLGADKPLFCGSWRKTELYSSADFRNSRTRFPGVTYTGTIQEGKDGLTTGTDGEIRFKRNFEPRENRVRMEIRTEEAVRVNGRTVCPQDGLAVLELEETPEVLIVQGGGTALAGITFYRPTAQYFDGQALAALREIVSFTKEFPYVSFLNFGTTLQTRESIRGKLWRGMWPSLFLMLPVFIGELVFGILLAMLACVYRGRLADQVIMILSVAGMSVSYLALIVFGQWFMAYYLNLFPVWGWGDPRHLALPVLIGIVSGTGGGVRFYRTVFLNEISREYLRTALAKGCSPWTIYGKHLLKNALVPIITRASTVLPFLFTGSLLLESFFGIPGLGYEGINALNDADLQMLKALVILGAFLFVGINLLTDLAYAWADPRVRVNR